MVKKANIENNHCRVNFLSPKKILVAYSSAEVGNKEMPFEKFGIKMSQLTEFEICNSADAPGSE